MKFLLAIILSLATFQVHALDKRDSLNTLVLESIILSGLDDSMNDQPADLKAVRRVLVNKSLLDWEIVNELKNIRYVIINRALATKNAQSRARQLEVAQFRILWLAGENGYNPQDQ